jgi:diacylglycerol kinase (ATP)
MNKSKNGFMKRIKSFGYAFTGLYELIKSEPNARIHLIATPGVMTAGLLLRLTNEEWCIVMIVIAMVWATEAFNTVMEKLTDHLFPEHHETARIAKDVSAAAVLISAIAAMICGLVIFLPKIILLFH